MVDFENETTITTSPRNILQILILQERDRVLESLKQLYNRGNVIIDLDTYNIKANLKVLFLELRAGMERDMETTEFTKLESDIMKANNITEFENCFNSINKWLDEKRLIRFDNIESYDRTRVEKQNRAKHL